MKNIVSFSIILLLAFAACSTPSASSPERFQAEAQQAEEERYDETVDAACAYFYFLWGKSAELEARDEEALEAYEKALVCDPGADYVMRKLILLHIKMDRKEKALALIEKMVADNPDDIETKLIMASLHVSMGKMEKATEVYNSLLEEDPDNVRILLMLGSLYARNKDYTKAQKIYERLVEKDPKSYLGYYFLGKLYRELLFYDKAIAAYEKALDTNWSSSLALEIGMLYEKVESYEQAIGIYKKLLEDDPSKEWVRRRLIGLYLKKEDNEQALAELEELRKYALDVETVDLTIGRVLLEQEKYDKAIEHFLKMLEESEEQDLARYLLALTYFQKGEKKTAKEMLKQLSPDFKGYEEAVLLLVKILEDEGDFAAAEEELKSRIGTEETRRISFYSALASLYKQQDKVALAKKIFEKAIEEYPSDPKLVYEYAIFLDGIGEQQAATAKMEEILVQNPDDPYALNYLGYTWADNNENLEKALEYIKKAVTLRPDDGFIRDSLGWVYYKMGDFDKAVSELEKAITLESDDPTINEHMGDAYLKANRLEDALKAYQKAFDNYLEEDKKTVVKGKMDEMR